MSKWIKCSERLPEMSAPPPDSGEIGIMSGNFLVADCLGNFSVAKLRCWFPDDPKSLPEWEGVDVAGYDGEWALFDENIIAWRPMQDLLDELMEVLK